MATMASEDTTALPQDDSGNPEGHFVRKHRTCPLPPADVLLTGLCGSMFIAQGMDRPVTERAAACRDCVAVAESGFYTCAMCHT